MKYDKFMNASNENPSFKDKLQADKNLKGLNTKYNSHKLPPTQNIFDYANENTRYKNDINKFKSSSGKNRNQIKLLQGNNRRVDPTSSGGIMTSSGKSELI